MVLCPIADENQSPVAQRIAALSRRIEGWLELSQDPQAVNLEKVEREIQRELNEVGLVILEQVLQSLDPGAREIVVEGERLHLALRSSQRYWTRFGMVRVERGFYRSNGRNGATVCPLEATAGIVAGWWTPGGARLLAHMMAELTVRDTQGLCREMGLEVSTSSLGRLPAVLSRAWEADREGHEELLRAAQTVPEQAAVVCTSIDGVLAPMRDKAASRQEKREAAGKHASGPAGYSEVGCATVSLHDHEGERLETIYHARMPELKKATLEKQVQAEVLNLQALNPQLRRVYLSDGAAINWQIAAEIECAVRCQGDLLHLPYQAPVEIVDYFHACEHLKRACDASFGEGTAKGKTTFENLRTILKERDDGAESVIRALRHRATRATTKRARQKIQTEINYFCKQKARMNYARYQQDNLPIGSGVVEAACKTIVTQRMKRSGMAWSPDGGQAILTMRAWLRSDRFELAWQIVSNRFKPWSERDITYAKPRLKLAA